MFNLSTVSYILSFIVAIFTIISAAFVVLHPPIILRNLPKSLRLYVIVCYIPIVIAVALSSICFATSFFIYEDEFLPIRSVINMANSYLTEILRTFAVVLAIERIIATIYIERYIISDKIWFFWFLTLFTVIFAVIFIVTVFNVVNDMTITFIVYTYNIFGMHVIALAVITVLYYLNRRMYKITAYRITLKKRYQIAENLKILAYIFPLMLVYTLLAPMGSITTLIRINFELPRLPFSILHISHNLPHLIILLRLIFINLKKNKNINVNKNSGVKNVLGKTLSTATNANTYFKDLKHQWK